MVNSLSLSTSWNGLKHGRPADALREIRQLGFERVELYAHWLPMQIPEIREALAETALRVTSLHGPCPVPPTAGDWLAEVDEGRRRSAVDAHRRTVDLAAELGARGVVVHLGRSGAKSLQGEIFEAVRTYGARSDQHLSLVDEARAQRRCAVGDGSLDAAVRSAVELGEYARGTGVGLGLECRDGFVEIPGLDEYSPIFQACEGLPVHYWHDAGHASKLENAGLLDGEEYLRRFGDRLLGIHLHDTRLDRDHQAPGQGDTDFSRLAPYLRPETIRTLELSRTVEASQIQPGIDVLGRAGILAG